MSEPIFRAVEHLFHHHRYHATSPKEAPVTLAIITAIEDEARSLGEGVSDAWHQVLTRHLTAGNMLAHVGAFVAGAEASPLVQAAERLALGPAGEAMVARLAEDVAGFLGTGQPPAAETPPAG